MYGLGAKNRRVARPTLLIGRSAVWTLCSTARSSVSNGGRRRHDMTWWTCPLENVTGQAQTLQITLCEDSAPWNYLLQSIASLCQDKPKPILPSKADFEETLATYMNAPNPAPTDIESY